MRYGIIISGMDYIQGQLYQNGKPTGRSIPLVFDTYEMALEKAHWCMRGLVINGSPLYYQPIAITRDMCKRLKRDEFTRFEVPV